MIIIDSSVEIISENNLRLFDRCSVMGGMRMFLLDTVPRFVFFKKKKKKKNIESHHNLLALIIIYQFIKGSVNFFTCFFNHYYLCFDI